MFAVILSVTDFQEITFGGCIAEVIPKKLFVHPATTVAQKVLKKVLKKNKNGSTKFVEPFLLSG